MSPAASYPPLLNDVVISIGPDGRLYFHDLDRQLIELALAISPDDPAMQRRLQLCLEAAESRPVSGPSAPPAAAENSPHASEGRGAGT